MTATTWEAWRVLHPQTDDVLNASHSLLANHSLLASDALFLAAELQMGQAPAAVQTPSGSAAPAARQVPVSIVAYTGGLMFVPAHGWCAVAVDGCELSASHPYLADHGNSIGQAVGHGGSAADGPRILSRGIVTDATAAGKEVLRLHGIKMPLQASIGLQIFEKQWVDPYVRFRANGQDLQSPATGCWLITRSRLREVSITPLGCDPNTTVDIQARSLSPGVPSMNFDLYVRSLGLDPAQLSAELRSTLMRQYQTQYGAVAQFSSASPANPAGQIRIVQPTPANPGHGHPGHGHPGNGHPGNGHPGNGHPGQVVVNGSPHLAAGQSAVPVATPAIPIARPVSPSLATQMQRFNGMMVTLPNTWSLQAAEGDPMETGSPPPSFEDWVTSLGLDPGTMSPELRSVLEAQFATMQPAPASGDPTASASWGRPVIVGAHRPTEPHMPRTNPQTLNAAARHVADVRSQTAAEIDRINRIQAICRENGNPQVELLEGSSRRVVDLAAHAISEGWSPLVVDNHCLRASLPRVPAGHVPSTQINDAVLEASLCRTGKLDNLDKLFAPQVLEASHRMHRQGLGVQEILLLAARANGYVQTMVHPFRSEGETAQVLQAAFSTRSIKNVLANVANKFLRAGFMAVEDTWRLISKKTTVNDFKAISSLRLTGDFSFVRIGNDGEIKQTTVSDEAWANQAEMLGRLIVLPYKSIRNDDAGALTGVPKALGRGGHMGLNRDFWKAYLANSDFFKAANNNYASGAGTALSSEALNQATTLFEAQKDADGQFTGLEPEILLYPSSLEQTAWELLQSPVQVAGGGSTKDRQPSNNRWYGKYTPAKSRYLENSKFTGYSAKAYYLLASPEVEPTVEVVFLDGVEEPTVETAEADFKSLGIYYRGTFGYGVALQSYRGGVKMKGEV